MSALFNLFYIYAPWLFHFFRMAFFCGFVAIVCLVYQYLMQNLKMGICVPVDSIAKISSSSENLIKNQLYLPAIKQFLIGNGYYYTPKGNYYGATDSGFLRQILYGGVGYLVVCFLFTAYFVYRIAQNWFEGSGKFILSTIAILSLLNIKADTYAFPRIMLVLLMFLSLFGKHGKQIVLFKRGNE